MNKLVKIISDDDGEKKDNPKWCLVDPCNEQGNAALCTQEFFGDGESTCVYETKDGKITCPDCILILNIYKKIKL